MTASIEPHIDRDPLASIAEITNPINTEEERPSRQPLLWLIWLSLLVVVAAVFIFIAWNNGIPIRP